MPRKKNPLPISSEDKGALQAKMAKPVSLRSYKEVVEYLEDVVNAHRLEVIPKEILTAGVYAGSVILQAIRMAKEEGEYTDGLPADMQQGTLGISADRKDMVAFLTAGDSAIQVRFLKKQQKQGNIVTVEATEVETKEPEESGQSLTNKAMKLIEMGKDLDEGGSESLFAE